MLQFYYEKNFFTVKVLRGNLERLPLKNLSCTAQKRLRALVTGVMESADGESARTSRETIEDIIYHEYGIGDREASVINEAVLARVPYPDSPGVEKPNTYQ